VTGSVGAVTGDAEAEEQEKKIQALNDQQRLTEGSFRAREVREHAELSHATTERVHVTDVPHHDDAPTGTKLGSAPNDPDARILPDDAADYDRPKTQQVGDSGVAEKSSDFDSEDGNPYFQASMQAAANEAAAAEGRQ